MAASLRYGVIALKHGAGTCPCGADAQKKSFCATEQRRSDVEGRRQAFWDEVAFISAEKLIFIDESGCNTSMTPRYGRAPAGKRVSADRPINRGKNVSIVGAIRLDGVVALRAFEGAINVSKFLDFTKRNLAPRLRRGDVVVMDNLSVHKDPSVRAAIERSGARLVFLPPYSPEFNPIEMYWSTFKRSLRRAEARTLHELRRAIQRVRRSLRLRFEDMYGHCGYA